MNPTKELDEEILVELDSEYVVIQDLDDFETVCLSRKAILELYEFLHKEGYLR